MLLAGSTQEPPLCSGIILAFFCGSKSVSFWMDKSIKQLRGSMIDTQLLFNTLRFRVIKKISGGGTGAGTIDLEQAGPKKSL